MNITNLGPLKPLIKTNAKPHHGGTYTLRVHRTMQRNQHPFKTIHNEKWQSTRKRYHLEESANENRRINSLRTIDNRSATGNRTNCKVKNDQRHRKRNGNMREKGTGIFTKSQGRIFV